MRRAEDGLDDDHSSVAWIHQQVSDDDAEQEGCFNAGGKTSDICVSLQNTTFTKQSTKQQRQQ